MSGGAEAEEGFFASLWEGVKDILGAVAPTLATAVFGPFGGVAVTALTKAVGLPAGAPPDQVVAAIKGAGPETLLALKQCESQFIKDMKALDVDVLRLENDDRASARNREIQLKDKTPTILAYIIVGGFFGVLMAFMIMGKPVSGGDAFLLLIGGLNAAFGGVIGYFFGSTNGSMAKTNAMMAAQTQAKK